MDDVVAKGRNAWRRIEAREAATYDDWIAVGRALVAGRAVAMAKAKCNAPVGGAYNKAYGRFLQEAGFASVIAPERYKIIKVVENIAAVARWRESLSPAERRRCNHPSTLWIGWKRSAAFGGPARQCEPRHAPVKVASGNGTGGRALGAGGAEVGGNDNRAYTRPVFWGGEAIRRAANAIRESYSTDFFVMARRALEAAVRDESDVDELLGPRRAPLRGQKADGAAADHVAA